MSSLISEAYRQQNRELHNNPSYGVSGRKWIEEVRFFLKATKAQSVLDYGAGKCTLMKALKPRVAWQNYDPAVPGLDEEPNPADLVVCTDVLEHVEPDSLPVVLDHMAALAKKAVFLVIATRPAKKTLPDGRNAHLVVMSFEDWFDRLRVSFRAQQIVVHPDEFWFFGEPRQALTSSASAPIPAYHKVRFWQGWRFAQRSTRWMRAWSS